MLLEEERQGDVLGRRELRHELPELQHHPHLATTQPGPVGLPEQVEPLIVVGDLSSLGPEDSGQAQQQRGLPAARRSGYCHGFTRVNLHGDAA